jgi:hypothetical protein
MSLFAAAKTVELALSGRSRTPLLKRVRVKFHNFYAVLREPCSSEELKLQRVEICLTG